MRAGRLRHKITIEQVSESQTGSGAVTESWSTFATVWAAKDMQRGREMFDADQITDVSQALFRIRYLSGVVPKMRVNDGGTVWNIKSVVTDNRKIYTELFCELAK